MPSLNRWQSFLIEYFIGERRLVWSDNLDPLLSKLDSFGAVHNIVSTTSTEKKIELVSLL